MTKEMPPRYINDSNKNKENENLCPLSLKLKEKSVSVATIYNDWFGIGTYTIIIPGGVYSLETLIQSGARTTIQHSRRIYHALDSLQPLLKH